jgi:hypothetical protein
LRPAKSWQPRQRVERVMMPLVTGIVFIFIVALLLGQF